MAIPLIAAGIAARAIASKLATRAVGGIVGAGAKTVAPVYKNIGTGSVKVVTPTTEFKRNTFNTVRTSIAKEMKSGQLAKDSAGMRERGNSNSISAGTRPPSKTIKINSNPTRAR